MGAVEDKNHAFLIYNKIWNSEALVGLVSGKRTGGDIAILNNVNCMNRLIMQINIPHGTDKSCGL